MLLAFKRFCEILTGCAGITYLNGHGLFFVSLNKKYFTFPPNTNTENAV